LTEKRLKSILDFPYLDDLEKEVPNYDRELREYDTHLRSLKARIEQAIEEEAIARFSELKQKVLE
jgi:hypothetical protein